MWFYVCGSTLYLGFFLDGVSAYVSSRRAPYSDLGLSRGPLEDRALRPLGALGLGELWDGIQSNLRCTLLVQLFVGSFDNIIIV